jgi:hypothetical protein
MGVSYRRVCAQSVLDKSIVMRHLKFEGSLVYRCMAGQAIEAAKAKGWYVTEERPARCDCIDCWKRRKGYRR